MDEQAIAAALEGKFFRGPSTFYQTQVYYTEELGDLDKRPTTVKKAQREEQLERQAEVQPTKLRIPVSLIIEAVLTAHRVSITDFRRHDIIGTRRPSLVACRQHAAWLIKKLRPDVSFKQIATRINYKDHSTVHHGCRRFERVRATYTPEVNKAMDHLRSKMGDDSI